MRNFFIYLLLSVSLFAQENFAANCLNCHQKLEIGFEKFYMQYLIKFSTKERIREAMFYYLRDPKAQQSVMEDYLIEKLGIMPKIGISDRELGRMIDIYIQRYDLKGKLR